MFVVQQFVLARCIMRFPINHHPEEPDFSSSEIPAQVVTQLM